MKNPNSISQRAKRFFLARWSGEDYPGAEPRFHAFLLAKDIAIFLLLPSMAVLFYSALKQPPRSSSAKVRAKVTLQKMTTR